MLPSDMHGQTPRLFLFIGQSSLVCGKPYERVSQILVTLTSHSDSHFEHSNTSFSENKLDGVDLNSNCRDCGVRKNRGKILSILAD